jgi:hypothetical protein
MHISPYAKRIVEARLTRAHVGSISHDMKDVHERVVVGGEEVRDNSRDFTLRYAVDPSSSRVPSPSRPICHGS